MATTLGPLVGKITADSSGFTAGMKEAGAAAQQFEQQANLSFTGATKSLQGSIKQMGRDIKGLGKTLALVQGQGVGGIAGGLLGSALGGPVGTLIGSQIGKGLEDAFTDSKLFGQLQNALGFKTKSQQEEEKKFAEAIQHVTEAIAKQNAALQNRITLADKGRAAAIKEQANALVPLTEKGNTKERRQALQDVERGLNRGARLNDEANFRERGKEGAAQEAKATAALRASLENDLVTPLDQQLQKVKDIRQSLNDRGPNGLGISPEQANRLLKQIDQKQPSTELPPTLLADSAEAAKFLAEQAARVANLQADPDEAKRQEQLLQAIQDVMKEVRDEIKKQKPDINL